MGTIESDLAALYLSGPTPGIGETVALPEEEARHLRALRLRPGEPVLLLDGRGGRGRGIVEGARGEVRVAAWELGRVEGRPYIALGLGLVSDKSRFEWCIEKAVELGVREVVPIMTERSQGRFHRDRAERIAVSALKQSQRSYLPILSEVTRFPALLERCGQFDLVCICHEKVDPTESLAGLLTHRRPQRLLLLIGPEGGFSQAEVAAAIDVSAVPVSLSDARLRSETAALAAVVVADSLMRETK
jgi:16S rRNA (uracil1498-N3)-methyltransferase